jgi:hypothetical protein
MIGSRQLGGGATFAISALWSAKALAHAPIKNIGTFYAYLLHPLVVLLHLLTVVALALLLGQQGRSAARRGLCALILGLGTGLVAPWRPGPALAEMALPAAALAVSLLVVAARRLPAFATMVLAFVSGVSIGLDSTPEGLSGRELGIAYAGLVAGLALFATIFTGLLLSLTSGWAQVAIRVVAAWIAAATLLSASLALMPPAGKQAPRPFVVEDHLR